jgi:hypothetical protein
MHTTQPPTPAELREWQQLHERADHFDRLCAARKHIDSIRGYSDSGRDDSLRSISAAIRAYLSIVPL